MSNKIQLDVTTNTANAIKGFQKVQNEILKTSRTADNANKKLSVRGGKGGSANGGFMGSLSDVAMEKLQGFDKFGIGDKVQGLAQMGGSMGRFGGILGRMGPYGAAVAAALSPAIITHQMGTKRAAQGQALFSQERTLEQRLGNIQKNQGGSGFVKGLTHDLQQMAIKGKVPIEELTKSASRMMLAFRGNQTEVKKWVSIIADMSAATGESTDFFADLIARAEQFGTVEASVLTQMNEKGIPIFAQLGELLGVSTEQAKKLAEQGKITAEQFKQAATAAHKISVAGANQNNVVKDAAYWNKQAQSLQDEMYAETYTKQLDAMKTRRAKERYEKEKAYYEDPEIQNFHEEWARMCVGLIEMGDRLKEGFEDLARGLGEVISDIWNWVDDKINGTQDFKAQVATNKLQALSNGLHMSATANNTNLADLVYNMEGSDSVAKLSEKIEQLKHGIRDTERRIANKHVDEENRVAGEQAIAVAKEQLEILEATLEQKQKDIAAEKERQRLAKISLDLQTKALLSDPQNHADVLKAWNLNNRTKPVESLEAVRTEFDAANNRIRTGSGTEQDAAFVQHFKPMLDRIEKENQKQAQLAKGREDFMLQQRAKSGDKDAQMQIAFGSLVEQMKKLEFGESEINDFINKQTSTEIENREKKIGGLQGQADSLQKRIEQFETALAKSATCFKTDVYKKTSYERGAWGQGLAISTPDTAAYQAQQQVKQMQDTNHKLQEQINLFKCEINAIKKLNLTPRAI